MHIYNLISFLMATNVYLKPNDYTVNYLSRAITLIALYLINWDNPSCQGANSSKASFLPTQIMQCLYPLQ